MTSTHTKQPLLLAVDGNSLAHRAYHALERTGLKGPDGRPTWATKGFCGLLLATLERYAPDALIVGFDDKRDSARKAMYPDYKATRTAKAPELYQQMDDIITMLGQMGVTVVIPDRLEADDVLASAAATGTAAGWKTIVVTSDRDAFALINATTAVLRVLNGGIEASPLITRANLFDVAGCAAGQYTDLAALRGDTSDNLPGAPGIGKVTASKLLAAYPNVRAAWAAYETDPSAVAAVIGKATAAKLVGDTARENVERNLALMAMRTDVPLPDLATARLPVASDPVLAALDERGLTSVRTAALTHLCRVETGAPAGPPDPSQNAGYDDMPLPEPVADQYGPDRDAAGDPLAHLSRTRPQLADLLTTAGYTPAPARPDQWSLTL